MVWRAIPTEVMVSQKLMKNMMMWYALNLDSGKERRIIDIMRIEDAAERDPFVVKVIQALFENMKGISSE